MKLSGPGNSRSDEEHHDHFQDKDSNGDDESTRHIIHITREVEQDSVSGPGLAPNRFQVAVSGRGRAEQNSDLPISSPTWTPGHKH